MFKVVCYVDDVEGPQCLKSLTLEQEKKKFQESASLGMICILIMH